MSALSQLHGLEAAKTRLAPSRGALVAAARPRRSSAVTFLAVSATATSPQPAAPSERPAADTKWREEFDRINAAFFAQAAARRNALRSGEFTMRGRRFPSGGEGRKVDLSKPAPAAAAADAPAAPAAAQQAAAGLRGGTFSMPKRSFPASTRGTGGAGGAAGSHRGGAFSMPRRSFPANERTEALGRRAPSSAAPGGGAQPAGHQTGSFTMPQRTFPPSDRAAAIAQRPARPASAPAAAPPKQVSRSPSSSPASSRGRSNSPSRAMASPSPSAGRGTAPLRDGGSAFRMPQRRFPPTTRVARTRTAAAATLAPQAETEAVAPTTTPASSSLQDDIARLTAQWFSAGDARRAELRSGAFKLRARRFAGGAAAARVSLKPAVAAAEAASEQQPQQQRETEGPRSRGALGAVAFRPRRRTFAVLPAISRLRRSAEGKVLLTRAAAREAQEKCERLRRELFGGSGGDSSSRST